jgi:O-antigen/teichoic acid export membrane protein
MSSVLPVISRALDSGREHAQDIFRRSFDFMSLTALPLIIGTTILATPIMVLLAGPDFALSGSVLRILIWAIGGSFLNSVMIYTMIAANEQRRLLMPYFIAVSFNVVANLIFIPHYTYLGASVITVLTELWVLLASAYLVWRYLKFVPTTQVLFKAILASLVMGVMVWCLDGLSIWLQVATGALVYGLMLLLLRAVRLKDISALLPKFN